MIKDRLYRIGIVTAVASTVMMGLTDNFTIWSISRFIAGLSSTAGLMFGSSLILNWLIRHNHRSELCKHFSGVGLGIVFCSATAILQSLQLAGMNSGLYFPTSDYCYLFQPLVCYHHQIEVSSPSLVNPC